MESTDKLKSKQIVPPSLLKAIEFDKTYFPIPIKECNEKLVSVKEILEKEKLPFQFNEKLTGTGEKRLFYLREGLIAPLLAVMKDLKGNGLVLRFEYLYRRLEEQKKLFENSVKKTIKQYPDLDHRRILEIAGIFVAATPDTAAHISGAALDVTLLDLNYKQVDLGVPYLFQGPQNATDSSDVPVSAREKRKLLCCVMEKHGFANYPFEYWHFSMGDKIAARILGKEYAIYGPVIFDEKTMRAEPVKNGEEIFDVKNIFCEKGII